ncbi:Nif11-like leader peptide family RiPP precursor [Desulforegula conservatrix]|uniref:Nif11-like leader peptide family RiPP precursor n=1 Tax=Desulforegula conservatrix TaxID=153026 RepID=UPI00041F45CE|nr:Nif11-like leader peptide family RiPP precursor [Desulforegula conservatrix]
MSLDHAKKMLEKLKTDKDLMEKVKAADNEGKKKIAEDMGLTFTAEEMKEAIKADSSLSDEDLATVAGGASGTWVAVGAGAAGAAAACGW